MRICVLGPVQVIGDAGPVGLPPRELDLLAVLAAMPNRVLAVDRLIEALWPAGPPPTSVKGLQVRVCGLRRALGGAARLRRQDRGYALALSEAELDAMEFEQLYARGLALVGDGRTADGAVTLRRALAHWRGPAFASHDQMTLVHREAIRLDELRWQSVEALAEAELALGRPAAVVADLSTLAVELPYRERLQALLMTGLHRTGRQADALAVYHRTRELLVEELGVEPGRELRDLYQALLTDDAAVRSPTAGADGSSALRTIAAGLDAGRLGTADTDRLASLLLSALASDSTLSGDAPGTHRAYDAVVRSLRTLLTGLTA